MKGLLILVDFFGDASSNNPFTQYLTRNHFTGWSRNPCLLNFNLFCLGQANIPKEFDYIMSEGRSSPNLIGNISKPDPIKCLPACKIQNNPNQMTYAPYPQKENFFYQVCRQFRWISIPWVLCPK